MYSLAAFGCRSAEHEPEPAAGPWTGIGTPSRLAADELRVGDLPRRVADHADDACFDREIGCRDAEPRRGEGEQRLASVRRSLPELGAGATIVRLPTVGPWSTVRRCRPSSTWMLANGHVEFLGDDLRKRCSVALVFSILPVKAVTVPSAWIASHESSFDGSTSAGHACGAPRRSAGTRRPHGRGKSRSDDQRPASPQEVGRSMSFLHSKLGFAGVK